MDERITPAGPPTLKHFEYGHLLAAIAGAGVIRLPPGTSREDVHIALACLLASIRHVSSELLDRLLGYRGLAETLLDLDDGEANLDVCATVARNCSLGQLQGRGPPGRASR